MARTKLTPKKDHKEREGRWVLRPKAERERITKAVRKEKNRNKKNGPPLLCTTPPQPKGPHPQGRWSRCWKRQKGGLRRLAGWRKWVGHHHHCQPDSWPRWLQRPGHLPWGRSLPEGSSALPSEARPNGRSS